MTAKNRVLALVALALALPAVVAAQASFTPKKFSEGQLRDLKLIVVQNNGRHKPLDTVARESVRFITEKSSFRGQEPIVTYLSWMFDGDRWMSEPMITVGYLPLRQELGLDLKRAQYSINELRDNKKLVELFHRVDEKERHDEKLDKVENEAKLAGTKLIALNEALSGEALRVIPNPMDATGSWFNFQEVAQAPFFDTAKLRGELKDTVDAFQKGDGPKLAASGAALRAELSRIAPDAMPTERVVLSEYRYNSLDPFKWAWVFYFLAFILLLIGMFFQHRAWYAGGMLSLILGFAVHVYGETLRVIVAGRPPVSNIYESMLFVAGAIVIFSLIFELVYRSRIFALTASALGVITLVMSSHLPISSDISPLVPVLRSAKWLTFHVLTILTGYSAAFLAGGLAFVGLGAHVLGRGDSPFAVRLDKFLYRVVQVTVLFLGSGIILGGVWANQSWGRYWGWDPKETWALISLLVYLVIIHGRMAGWLKRFGTNLAAVIGLNMVIMTYYGVNYFLVGLHSYAGGTAFNVPTWVYLFVVAEAIFVLLAYLGASSRKKSRVAAPVAPPAAPHGVEA